MCWWLPFDPSCCRSLLLLLLDLLLAALVQARAAGRDEANLHPRGSATADRRRVPDVLVVASAVRVLDRVHRHTTNLGPAVALHAVLVEVVPGLEDRLVEAATAGHDANHRASIRRDRAARPGRHADPGLLAVIRMADDDAGRAGGLRDAPTVTRLLLQRGPLRHPADREDVANVDLRLGTAIHELARVHALNGDEDFLVNLVAVLVAEVHLGERRPATRVVDDLLDKALHEPLTLGEVHAAELRSTLAADGVGFEDATLALAAAADHASHCVAEKLKVL